MSRVPRLAGLLLLAAAALHAESAATGTRELLSISGAHYKITWSVPEAKLQDTGIWDSHHEPRLSIAQAVSIARTHLRSLGEPDQLPVVSAQLRRPVKLDQPGAVYFYFISFDDLHSDDPGPQAHSVIVLLDGTVVPAQRTST
jgi:hypothetical protein